MAELDEGMRLPDDRRTQGGLETTTMSGVPMALPADFTFAQAREIGLSKHAVYALRDAGLIESLARGLYRRTDAPAADLGLIAIARKAPSATLCLATALVRHGLSDAIPVAMDVALPRGSRPPVVAGPVQWHRFDPATFDIGRGEEQVDGSTMIGLYAAERSIVDAFRLRGTEGPELGHEALRRWLRRPGSSPRRLMTVAGHWPRTVPALRKAMEVLL